jgi:hypothetical protein
MANMTSRTMMTTCTREVVFYFIFFLGGGARARGEEKGWVRAKEMVQTQQRSAEAVRA